MKKEENFITFFYFCFHFYNLQYINLYNWYYIGIIFIK